MWRPKKTGLHQLLHHNQGAHYSPTCGTWIFAADSQCASKEAECPTSDANAARETEAAKEEQQRKLDVVYLGKPVTNMNDYQCCQELELRGPVKNNEHTIHTVLDGEGKPKCVGFRPNGPNIPPSHHAGHARGLWCGCVVRTAVCFHRARPATRPWACPPPQISGQWPTSHRRLPHCPPYRGCA